MAKKTQNTTVTETQTTEDTNQVGGDETFTFLSEGEFQVTVKSSFLKVIPNPDKHNIVELITEHKLPNFLHNPSGPAMVRVLMDQNDPLSCEYWVNGQMIDDPEVIARMKHNNKFNDKFTEMLNKDETK